MNYTQAAAVPERTLLSRTLPSGTLSSQSLFVHARE